MPYIEFNCQNCNKYVRTHRSKKVIKEKGLPKFCSYGCRDGGLPGFSWKTSTEEEIKKHVELIYNKYVIRQEGCWDWKGIKDKNGYGILSVKNLKFRRAHRVSWYLKYRSLPSKFICHTCDNPVCTNPLHLFAGDAKSNKEDEVFKRRHQYGSKNGFAKINEEQAKEIKLLLRDTNLTQKEIAKRCNVSRGIVNNIKNKGAWSHVTIDD